MHNIKWGLNKITEFMVRLVFILVLLIDIEIIGV